MNYQITHLEELLRAVANKTKQPLDHHGFEVMAESISKHLKTRVSSRYLYETLQRRIQKEKLKANGKKELVLQPFKVENLLHFLGYERFDDFIQAINYLPSPILNKLPGVYQCYQRRNMKKGVVLHFPVLIHTNDSKTLWRSRSTTQEYNGEVVLENNCLVALMRSVSGKQFHHVYRIGRKERPQVLQGIFSGITTSLEPIGGRVVLIRTEEKFNALAVQAKEITVLTKSKIMAERRLAEYFTSYSENNLSLPKTMTFDLDDLGECD